MLELVAQWTRAYGYEPCGRGFESLLAQKKHKTRAKFKTKFSEIFVLEYLIF
jgi:tRNA(Met) C34 N-acetyltransferase TmcA